MKSAGTTQQPQVVSIQQNIVSEQASEVLRPKDVVQRRWLEDSRKQLMYSGNIMQRYNLPG